MYSRANVKWRRATKPWAALSSPELHRPPGACLKSRSAFDIDANGIVEVSAKDQATGKQQSIRITHSSGLSREEIDRLIKDAELHAGEDKARKELIDARNAADSLIYATEKSMAELGDKLPAGTRNEVQGVISDLKRAMDGDNTSEIKRLTETLTHASHRLAESVYQQPGPRPDSKLELLMAATMDHHPQVMMRRWSTRSMKRFVNQTV